VNYSIVFAGKRSERNKAFEYLQKRGEVYFSIDMNTRSKIKDLTLIVSLDKIDGNKIYAYANEDEFNRFLKFNLDYQVLTPPGELLVNPKMSDFEDPNNRDWNAYPTYQGYVNLLSQFESSYPDICKVEDLGPSGVASKNHRIYAVKITDNIDQDEAEPGLILNATIHGDETLGYVMMLHFIDTLLSNYSSDPEIKNLVDNIETWILPLCNPDGTYPYGDSSVNQARRYNLANNWDLNRNNPCPCLQGNHQLYGLYSYYAAETQARLDFENQHNFALGADIHGGVEAVVWPFQALYLRHTDENWFKFIAHEYVDQVHDACNNNGYMTSLGGDGMGHGYTELYEAHGTISDSRPFFQQCRTLYLELSVRKNLPAPDLLRHWEYNYRSLFAFLEQAFNGIQGTVTDSKTGGPLHAKVYIENHDKDNSHVYSNLPHGDYYRPIIAGTYDITFSSDGYHPKTIENVIVENNKATILNVELISNLSISITKPQGNETLYVGEVYPISWLSHSSVGDVRIDYSINTGSDWSMVVDRTVNDGSHPWTIPDEPSTSCLLRIYEIDDNYPSDTSDYTFTISTPVIELTSPNGGETLYEGDEETITWENKGLVGNVDIEYSIDNGQNWLTIASNVVNSGTHPWTIPGNPSSSCLLRVSETADGDPVDVSDSVFTISSPIIVLSSPNGGEAWYIGKSYTITWSTRGFVGDVKIEYSTDSGTNWIAVINSTANDGSHLWTIPDDPSMTCKIRISEAYDGDPADESDGVFIIEIEPSIALTFPVGNEVLYIDSMYTIRWTTIGRVGDVRISSWYTITNQTENDGLYEWLIPDVTPGAYIMRISEAADGVPSFVSDSIFIEYAPKITVSHPNGGEILYIGMVYKVQWVNTGSVGDIRIDYSTDNGTEWKTVVSRITNTASYNWKIPDDESEQCLIKVSEASNGDIVDISDISFSIAPPYIEVSSPNGGEVLLSGYTHYVTWEGKGFTGDVRIDYSADNGTNWMAVINKTANDGSHAWMVPNNPSANCKIRISEVTNSNPFDESDSPFKIEFGTAIQNTKPNAFNGSFDIIPNPVDKGTSQEVSFYITSAVEIKEAIVKVYDAVGNELFILSENNQLISNTKYLLGTWNLRAKTGKLVSDGLYMAILKIKNNVGEIYVVKKMIGVIKK
jgi:hypothetical protein